MSKLLAEKVTEILKETLKSSTNFPIPLHEPSFTGNEWKYVKDCIDSTFVSSVGKYVDQFEDAICSFTESLYAISVVNGTSALHIALILSGIEKDDEVLIPALTFVATANAVRYIGAIPHFIDSSAETLGINPFLLKEYLLKIGEIRGQNLFNRSTGRRIKCVIPMHTFGHPVDLDGLLAVAKDFNLTLVEDAAESLGSKYFGKQTGTFGKFGILSFNGNKTITTGGGGAILTQDRELAVKAKHLTTTARIQHQWEYIHDEIGYNYRLPNINAALGCAQIEVLPSLIKKKRRLFQTYENAFHNVSGVKVFKEPKNCESNYWLQTILLDANDRNERDALLVDTNRNGFSTRPVWTLLDKLPPFRDFPKMELTNAYNLESRIINIPSSANLVK